VDIQSGGRPGQTADGDRITKFELDDLAGRPTARLVAGCWFNRHMIDVGWLVETWRAGRWEAIVMIWNAIVADVIAYPWFAVVLAVLVVSAGVKGLSRLARYVGGAYWSSHH